MRKGFIEGCVDSFLSSRAACRGGADRLELCANLAIGGTTPSLPLFRQVRRDCPVKVNVLIRPRFGDFLYDQAELEEMAEEIDAFPEGEVDRAAMARLMARAGGLSVTLHRAFDMTRDPFAALETAVSLGCRTILTSGQERSAAAGKDLLRELRTRAAGRIEIMAGSGVRKDNIQEIHDHTGIITFHTTGRKGPVDSGMVYRKSTVSMGLPSLSEYELWRTDEEEFALCARIVHGLAE